MAGSSRASFQNGASLERDGPLSTAAIPIHGLGDTPRGSAR